MAALDVVLVPALSDNYVYLAHDPATGATAVIDPAEAAPVIAALEARGWKPTHILNTHHHHDHIGGNAEIKARYGCTLVGPKGETARIAGMDVTVGEGDTYDFAGHKAKVFETPGHTSGHIVFWFEADGALFAGDTLFALGCGRVNEGTMAEMWASLDKLRVLPPSTLVYCGHEYTQANARFALSVDGGNPALKAYARRVDETRARGEPTIPSLLGDELAANPFLRADDPVLAANVGKAGASAAEVFGEVRRLKNVF